MAKPPVKNAGRPVAKKDDDDEPQLPPGPDRTKIQASPFAPEEPKAKKRPTVGRGTPAVVINTPPEEEEERNPFRDEPPAPQKGRSETRLADPDPGSSGFEEKPRRRNGTGTGGKSVSGFDAPVPAPDSDATNAGPPFSLEITAGPDKNTQKRIRGGRMIIGRGDGCDLQLLDASVSRRHVELVSSGSGVVLRDLGSGNGTKVNGKKVPEATLVHGDKIAIGQTVIQIIDELKKFEEQRAAKEAARRPQPEPEPEEEALQQDPTAEVKVPVKRAPRAAPIIEEVEDKAPEVPQTAQINLPKHLRRSRDAFEPTPPAKLYGLIAIGVLSIVLLVWMAVRLVARPEPAGGAVGLKSDDFAYEATVKAGKDAMREALDERAVSIRQERYATALKKFEEAKEIAPSRHDADRLIENARIEVNAATALVEAKKLSEAGNYDDAIATLEKVKDLSLQIDLVHELEQKYDLERGKRRVIEARAQLQQGQLDKARMLAQKLPDADRKALEAEITEAEQRQRGDEVRRQVVAVAQAERRKADKVHAAQAEVDSAIAGVVRKVEGQNFDGAMKELDRVAENTTSELVVKKVKALRRQIPEFGKAYQDAMHAWDAGAYEIAAGPIGRALKLYEDMDIEGHLDGTLREKLGKATLEKGRAAMNRQEYGLAVRTLKEALGMGNLKPNETSDAREMLAQIGRKAKEVYMEGYVEKTRSPETARRKFRETMEISLPGSEYYQKAEKSLENLDKN